jgi:hypothetical protein
MVYKTDYKFEYTLQSQSNFLLRADNKRKTKEIEELKKNYKKLKNKYRDNSYYYCF